MPVSLVGSQATELAATGLTLPVYKHQMSPLAVGDFLLVQADSSGTGPAVTTPANYSLYFNTTSGTVLRQATFGKAATASDITGRPDQPVNVTYNSVATARGTIAAFRGVNVADITTFQRSSVAGTSQTPTAPSVTTPCPNCIVVVMVQTNLNSDVTPPSGFTELQDTGALLGANTSRGAMSWKLFPTEGATGALAASVGTSQAWVATAIVLPPADQQFFVSAATAVNTNATVRHVVATKPAGATFGDSYLVGVKVDSTTTQVRTDPRFVLLSDTTSGTFRFLVYKHTIAPQTSGFTEPAGYEFRRDSAGYIAAMMLCYRGAMPSGEILGARTAAATASGTTHATSLTTLYNNSLLVSFFAEAGDNSGTTIVTPPGGMTERAEVQLIEGADVRQAVAGASGTKTATYSTTAVGVACALELRAKYTREPAQPYTTAQFWGTTPDMYFPPQVAPYDATQFSGSPEIYFAASAAPTSAPSMMLMGVG